MNLKSPLMAPNQNTSASTLGLQVPIEAKQQEGKKLDVLERWEDAAPENDGFLHKEVIVRDSTTKAPEDETLTEQNSIAYDPDAPESWMFTWQEDGMESLLNYCPGGYHPVHLEDEFCDGRYFVIHKLGSGTYSTVWLAQDRHQQKYVALKILVADASEESIKPQILRSLGQDIEGNRHPGSDFVTSLWDDFYIDGPNGRHLCLVLQPAGCSVSTEQEASYKTSWMFKMSVARRISSFSRCNTWW